MKTPDAGCDSPPPPQQDANQEKNVRVAFRKGRSSVDEIVAGGSKENRGHERNAGPEKLPAQKVEHSNPQHACQGAQEERSIIVDAEQKVAERDQERMGRLGRANCLARHIGVDASNPLENTQDPYSLEREFTLVPIQQATPAESRYPQQRGKEQDWAEEPWGKARKRKVRLMLPRDVLLAEFRSCAHVRYP